MREEVFGFFNAGDVEGGRARINELVSEGALSQEEGFRYAELANRQIAQQEAELNKQQGEIDQEHRGLAAERADVFLATELDAIAKGESALPDGADIAQAVEDDLDEFLEGQPEAFKSQFKKQVRPQLVKAHLKFSDGMRASAVNEGLALRASALHAAGPEDSETILRGVHDLAARTPDIITPEEAVGRVALRAAELAAEIDGDVETVDRLSKLSAGQPGERFGLEFEEVRQKAKDRRAALRREQTAQAREALEKVRLSGASLEHINATARGMVSRGEISANVANQYHSELHNQRRRSLTEAQEQAELAARNRATETLGEMFRGQMSNPNGAGLAAMVADPNLQAAVESAGLPSDTIAKARDAAVHNAISNIEADTSLTPQQKRSRQINTLSLNGQTYKPWTAQLDQGVAAGASVDMVEGVALPDAALAGYQLWDSIRTESPQSAATHATNPATRRYYEMIDLAKRHVFPDDPAAGIDTTDQAVRMVNRRMRSMAPASIQSDAKVLRRATSWIDDAYNAPEIRSEVKRLAELYLGAGVASSAEDALEAASENVQASVQRVGEHYVYARDMRLPEETAKVATGIIEGFADTYGSILGLNKRQIALMPDPDGSGLWQMFDTSGGVPVPIQTSLPGGASFKPGATSFTPDELAGIAAGMFPPPNYAAETVEKHNATREEVWNVDTGGGEPLFYRRLFDEAMGG